MYRAQKKNNFGAKRFGHRSHASWNKGNYRALDKGGFFEERIAYERKRYISAK